MADPTSPAPRRSLRQRASKAQLAPEADEPVKTSTRKRSTAKLRAEPSEAEAAGTLHTPANGSADPDGAKKPVGERCVCLQGVNARCRPSSQRCTRSLRVWRTARDARHDDLLPWSPLLPLDLPLVLRWAVHRPEVARRDARLVSHDGRLRQDRMLADLYRMCLLTASSTPFRLDRPSASTEVSWPSSSSSPPSCPDTSKKA